MAATTSDDLKRIGADAHYVWRYRECTLLLLGMKDCWEADDVRDLTHWR